MWANKKTIQRLSTSTYLLTLVAMAKLNSTKKYEWFFTPFWNAKLISPIKLYKVLLTIYIYYTYVV